MNTQLTIDIRGFDRRHARRNHLGIFSLHCWQAGRKISLHIIEATECGARVILPPELSRRQELTLVCRQSESESYGEYRVVWKERIAGGKAIAGLQCLLSSQGVAA